MTKSKALAPVVFHLLLAFLITLGWSASAEAQATIGVSSSATVVTKIGYTELIGPVSFSVVSGVTNAGTIGFSLQGLKLTETSGITVTGSGGLTTATIATVAADGGFILINIPAGATPGSAVTLSGVRISAVNQTFTAVNATISSSANFIVAGQTTVPVVRAAADGLILDTAVSSMTFTVISGTIVGLDAPIAFHEGWEQSFSGHTGVNGQTARTQVILKVSGLPDGVSLVFPSPVFSDSSDGAFLTIVSGQTVTNLPGEDRVVYEFQDSIISDNVLDGFSITPTVGITPPAGSGTAVIQVALGPIGAEVPNLEFPSTAVPRFKELFLPESTGGQATPARKSFLVPPGASTQVFTLSNTASGGALVTVRARLEDGTLSPALNPATVNLAPRQTTSVSLTDLFGPTVGTANVASVELGYSGNDLVANSIATVNNKRFGLPMPSEEVLTFLPFDRQTSPDNPILMVQNPGDLEIQATITAFANAGTSIAVANRTIAGRGSLREAFSSLFGSASIPLSGYVTVRGSTAVRSVLLNYLNSAPDAIPSLLSSANSPIRAPFFAFGGGYNTVLTLMNVSATLPVRVTLTAFITPATTVTPLPVIRTLAPGERQTFDFAALFSLNPADLRVGHFALALESATPNPFATPAAVAGTLRMTAGTSASAVVPLLLPEGTQFNLIPTAETTTNYTGISILNPSPNTAASVTIEALSSAGALIGSNTFSVAPGTTRVQLLRELIPQSLTHTNGLVRISSTGIIRLVSFSGALNLSELIYLRTETNP